MIRLLRLYGLTRQDPARTMSHFFSPLEMALVCDKCTASTGETVTTTLDVDYACASVGLDGLLIHM
jgi:hypothetical protein